MEPTKEVRVHQFGRFLYSLKVPQSQTLAATAQKAAEVMKLTHLTAEYGPGVINFVAKDSLKVAA